MGAYTPLQYLLASIPLLLVLIILTILLRIQLKPRLLNIEPDLPNNPEANQEIELNTPKSIKTKKIESNHRKQIKKQNAQV